MSRSGTIIVLIRVWIMIPGESMIARDEKVPLAQFQARVEELMEDTTTVGVSTRTATIAKGPAWPK